MASKGSGSNGGAITVDFTAIFSARPLGTRSGKRFMKPGISAMNVSRVNAELNTHTSAVRAEVMLVSGNWKSHSSSLRLG